MSDRVVVTALSAITPIGSDIETIANNLRTGQCGIRGITRFEAAGFPVRHAAEVDISQLDEIAYLPKANLQFKLFYYSLTKLLTSFTHHYSAERVGCIIGTDPNTGTIDDWYHLFSNYTNNGDNKNIDQDYLTNINPAWLLYHVSKDFKINGPAFCNLGTCSASTQAIGSAYKLLKSKEVDLVIAGGFSTKIDPISITRLCRLSALEETRSDITDNCKPFDKERSGFTMGEGCILFTLEREKDAKKRNATIFCEVKGYGAALDGFSMTDPHEDALGMAFSMKRAIADAGLDLNQIDYLNAHGTATVKNDLNETKAIKTVFGDYAKGLDISSTKSMHGHLMTATGAMEVLVSILAIRDNFVPPTINYKTFDKDCDLNYTPNEAKYKMVKNVLSNTFGLGGQNASLVISKYEE